MNKARGNIQMVEVIDPSETKQERLVKLHGFLSIELQSDMPSPKYIEDLKETIQVLEGRV